MNSVGLYIGRFQPFHLGHKKLIDQMLEETTISCILIGLSKDISKNPYSFETRKLFFTQTYPHNHSLHIYPLSDNASDIEWIQNILSIPEIHNSQVLSIYAGDMKYDSAIQVIQDHISLFGNIKLNFIEVSRKILPISGTDIRLKIQKNGLESIKSSVPGNVYKDLQNKH